MTRNGRNTRKVTDLETYEAKLKAEIAGRILESIEEEQTELISDAHHNIANYHRPETGASCEEVARVHERVHRQALELVEEAMSRLRGDSDAHLMTVGLQGPQKPVNRVPREARRSR